MNALLGFLLVVAYVGILFIVSELCGFNKIDDEH
jgi:hypothetical protein